MKNLIIIGAGPAGLTASIYASRYKIDNVVIGSEMGGYVNETPEIENYPGLLGISGPELGQKLTQHAKDLGAEILQEEVKNVEKIEKGFKITTHQGEYQTKKILYAIGTKVRKLGIPGEEELTGRGVSFCATCDGPFFKEKKVVVVGGGNSAAISALMLSQHASSVKLIYRGKELKAIPVYQEKMAQTKNLEVICCTNLTKINGENKVENISLDNPHRGKETISTDGVFIEIGSEPDTHLIDQLKVDLDKYGYIKTNPDQSTNVPGFYAAGDITTGSNGFRQIITACSEGAIAALSIFESLKG